MRRRWWSAGSRCAARIVLQGSEPALDERPAPAFLSKSPRQIRVRNRIITICHRACATYPSNTTALSKPFTVARKEMKRVDAFKLRRNLGLNLGDFWGRTEVTQSGGSRCENGRSMPRIVRKLLGIVYLKEKP